MLVAALLVPLAAFGQSYPSPTFNNLTVQGTFTASGKVGLASLATQAANTVVANVTGSSASPTAVAMPSCSASGNALNYTSGTGWSCATGFALLASPALTGTPTAPTATAGTNTTQIATTAFVQAASGSGRLLNIQVISSSGTYTATAGTNKVFAECVGGGGGGAGTPATNSTTVAVGAGGASGSYARAYLTSGFSGQTVTIGSGGAGGVGANGTAGGQTSFGALLVAPGGGSGQVVTASNTGYIATFGGQPGAVATGGNIVNSAGTPGGNANAFNGITQPGVGASSPYGGGGYTAFQGNGGAATGYGSGGAGVNSGVSQPAYTGGSGKGGVCVIDEFS
jgi:hypothetical protein